MGRKRIKTEERKKKKKHNMLRKNKRNKKQTNSMGAGAAHPAGGRPDWRRARHDGL